MKKVLPKAGEVYRHKHLVIKVTNVTKDRVYYNWVAGVNNPVDGDSDSFYVWWSDIDAGWRRCKKDIIREILERTENA